MKPATPEQLVEAAKVYAQIRRERDHQVTSWADQLEVARLMDAWRCAFATVMPSDSITIPNGFVSGDPVCPCGAFEMDGKVLHSTNCTRAA